MSAPFSPPSLLERTLVRVVGDSEASDAALGDLREELAARARGGAAWRAWLWYAREAWSLAWAIGRERRRDAAWRSSALARRRRQGDSIMRILLDDMWFAARALWRRPLFASLVIATLALGIGGNVAVFSVVDGVLLRPLPYPDPERLVIVWENDRLRGSDREAVSAPDFRDFVEMSRSFEALAARSRLDRTLGALAEPVRVSSARVTASYFSLLGVRPHRWGACSCPRRSSPARTRVVVLTESLWRAHFGADPRVDRRARAARRRAAHARGRGAGVGAHAGAARRALRAARLRPERPVPRTPQPARDRAAQARGHASARRRPT